MKKKVLGFALAALVMVSIFATASKPVLEKEIKDPCPPTANTECYKWANGTKSCLYGGEEHSLNCEDR